jgi:dTDP-glucose pyrophosphorylase
MRTYKNHLILTGSTVKQALTLLNELSFDSILFVVDHNYKLIGSITDGDVRRGLLRDFTIESKIDDIIQPQPKFIRKGDNDIKKIIDYREQNCRVIPILDEQGVVVNIINFRNLRSYLPLDAVIMAGGRGQRLQPLTDTTPKPLLMVGEKPIIEHNIDRLAQYGIDNIWISVNYLGDQIKNYFGDGSQKNIKLSYVSESLPLGTIGAVSSINNFFHDYILIINSDLLNNIDFENFFLYFIENEADFAVLSIPYQVKIPYAVLETTDEGYVKNFSEKPTYTFYSNGGVYLLKKNILELIPYNSFYNATDLMKELIEENYKVISYPFLGYWLDIGKHEDFQKAQRDIQNIVL